MKSNLEQKCTGSVTFKAKRPKNEKAINLSHCVSLPIDENGIAECAVKFFFDGETVEITADYSGDARCSAVSAEPYIQEVLPNSSN